MAVKKKATAFFYAAREWPGHHHKWLGLCDDGPRIPTVQVRPHRYQERAGEGRNGAGVSRRGQGGE